MLCLLIADLHADLRAPILDQAFASDASSTGGGITVAPASSSQRVFLYDLAEGKSEHVQLDKPGVPSRFAVADDGEFLRISMSDVDFIIRTDLVETSKQTSLA